LTRKIIYVISVHRRPASTW